MKSSQLSLRSLLFLLAGLTALAPLAIDAYLPAIPSMAISFGTSIHHVELSLSLFLAGFAIGQLIGGPLSDHFGRRLTVFVGLSIFAFGTLGIIFSSTLNGLLLFRIIEALGGGMAIVNSGAIIRDVSSGRDSARNLSQMALIMMMAPLLAPVIGMGLLHVTGWHGIFVFLLSYTVIITFFIYRNIPETRAKNEHRPSAIQRYLEVLKHRQALGYVFALCFAYGGMFAFITGSPSVYMGFFNISETIYPLFFGANIVTMILANRVNVRLLRYCNPSYLLSLGQSIQLVTGVALLSYVSIVDAPLLAVVVGLVMLFVGSQSFIVSNATSSTIEFFPNNSGTASALLGASGFATGALSGSLVGLLGDGTPLPMALVMTGCIIMGISLRFFMQRLNKLEAPE
jgi:DHA1 family bicyclomycin/chloramphenicol resistance-like MFS transporter